MTKKLAIYRMLERVVPRPVLWKLGRFLYQGARRDLVNDPHINGEYALFDRLRPRWAKGQEPLLFLDVGANFADWSVELLGKLGTDTARARVVAFEPAPAQADRAERRLAAAAGAGRVELMRAAVGAESGTVSFDITGVATGNSSIAVGQARGECLEVPLVRLDALPELADVPTVHLVKVDTEGNDFNVIRGAEGLFARGAIEVLQFEYNWRWLSFGHVLRDVFAWIEGRGYTIGMVTQDALEMHGAWHPELERFFETNFVIVRDDLIDAIGAQRMRFGQDNVVRSS